MGPSIKIDLAVNSKRDFTSTKYVFTLSEEWEIQVFQDRRFRNIKIITTDIATRSEYSFTLDEFRAFFHRFPEVYYKSRSSLNGFRRLVIDGFRVEKVADEVRLSTPSGKSVAISLLSIHRFKQFASAINEATRYPLEKW